MYNAPLRIAMWSGPRSISTPLMRSWGNRPDTVVCDEPLCAHYLKQTGKTLPLAAEIIASQETDWRKVVKDLTTAPLPEGKIIYYQKHRTQHFLPCINKDWLGRLTNCFLIQDPQEILAALMESQPEAEVLDTGLPQQAAIFDWVREQISGIPPIIDAKDLLEEPRGILERLCTALDVPFDERMLAWPPGPRATDGVWGARWYAPYYEVTSFQPYEPRTEKLTPALADLLDECLEYYEHLHRHRLTV